MGPFRIRKNMKIFSILILFTLYLSANGNPALESISVSSNETLEDKRAFIRNMTLSAWNAYSEFAWGGEALGPIARGEAHAHFGKGSGHTVVAALSTLSVMGLKEQFAQGRKWVRESLDFAKLNRFVSVRSSVTDFAGGLVSAYALSGDDMFLQKAKEVVELLEPAYNSTSGLPFAELIPSVGAVSDPEPYLSQITFQQPELIYLASRGPTAKISACLQKIRNLMRNIAKSDGLYWRSLRVKSGKWISKVATLFEQGRDFYQNMVTSYLISDGKDVQVLEMYCSAMDAIERNGMFGTSGSGLVYARNLDNSSMLHNLKLWMDYSGCYLGAMLSLGAQSLKRELEKNVTIEDTEKRVQQERIERHMKLAEDLTETCHQAAVRTRSGLPPATFLFKQDEDATNKVHVLSHYNLSPELAESYFVLWRLTHQTKYRDYAWQLVKAIENYCKTESGGYATVRQVNKLPTEKTDFQQAHFLSGTLKYLYLIFTDDSVLPLDSWVFNAAGHPLPVCGKHQAYPVDKC